MPSLALELNKFHQTSYSLRFWQITVGYWFRQYLDVFYDRYKILRKVQGSGRKFQVVTIKEHSEWIANDTDEYSVYLMSDLLNHQLFSQIISRASSFVIQSEVSADKQASENIGRNKSGAWFKKYLFHYSSILVRYNSVIINRSYFSFKLSARLAFKFLSIPLLGTPRIDCGEFTPDRAARKAFRLKVKNPTEFETLVSELCGRNIPKVFFEGFEKATAIALKTLPKRARLYLTANAFAAQELYKMWVAHSLEVKSSKHIIVQHGGNYGHSNVHSEERFERTTADYFVTSGWSVDGDPKIVPLVASPRLGGIGNYEKNEPKILPSGHFLWVLASLPRYQYTQWSAPQGPSFLSYLDDQKSFVSHIDKKLYNHLLCRPYTHDYGWNDLEYIDPIGGEFSVDLSRRPLRKQILSARLSIFTYDSTSMMESMALNLPTMCYWIPDSWAWRPSAQPLLDAMEDVSIFHSSGKQAAEFLSKLEKDGKLGDWWASPEVQLVRSRYCKEYALTRSNEFSLWSEFFKTVLT